MSAHLYLAFSVVFPLFINMALGYLLYSLKILRPATVHIMNRVVFNVFLPLLLFVNIARSDLSMGVDYRLLLFALGSILLIFLVLVAVVPRFEKDNQRKGVLVQGIFRSNFVIFGFPVAVSLCGEDQVHVVAMLVAAVVPLYNILAVLSLEMFRSKQIDWPKIVRGVLKNPLIFGAVSSLLLLLAGIEVPEVMMNPMRDLASIATPLALVLLGASFRFSDIGRCFRPMLAGVTGKLLVLPLVFLPLALALGFRGVQIAGLLALYGSPSAVSSYTMAVQMGGDGELAGQIVVFSSILSILTMFFWIVVLKQGGFI